MTCPVCHSPMLKAKRRPDQKAPSKISCVHCRFQIIFRGIGKSSKLI
jgi:hypothetical protein